MPRRQSENFPKSARLRKRSEYLRVQRNGIRVQSRLFVGVFQTRDSGGPRVGVTTTKRLGGAVIRNRFRRLVREAYRRGILTIPTGVDLVVIVKTKATLLGNSQAIFDDLAKLGLAVTKSAGQQTC